MKNKRHVGSIRPFSMSTRGDICWRGGGKKRLNKDGHLITEDSVLPTTAPGGAPEQNRCYQTPATLLVLPLAPASLARSAHLAPLTPLRPRWGLARSVWFGMSGILLGWV
jgi:hypothetical protein